MALASIAEYRDRLSLQRGRISVMLIKNSSHLGHSSVAGLCLFVPTDRPVGSKYGNCHRWACQEIAFATEIRLNFAHSTTCGG
jgi:hypothetical protein